jgi:hypothetical protein
MNAAMVPMITEDTLQWIEFNKLCYEQGLNVTSMAFQMWLYNIGQVSQLQSQLHNEYYQQPK